MDRGLGAEQLRFTDGDARGWLERWYRLRNALSEHSPLVTVGAAIHSVRAVPREGMRLIAAELPAEVPLHIHLSEQQAENSACADAYRLSPTEVLAEDGVLSERLSAVHATHLSTRDVQLLAQAGVRAVFCPSTEADLGDGVGPARELHDAGVALAVGSDQNAVIDPLLELRGLEAGERLISQRRGRFSPAELWKIGSDGGYRALGHQRAAHLGGPLDLVEIDTRSLRTVGSDPEQLIMSATSADIRRVVVGGKIVTVAPEQTARGLERAIAMNVSDSTGGA